MKRSIPILLYHHVSPDREITPAGFERQLRWLLEQGYQCLSMEEVLKRIRGEYSIDRPAFAVTFDDGYLDNWIYAFPILKNLGVNATVYVVTERVESGPARSLPPVLDTRANERGPGGFLAWSELREMAASGLVAVGSHTHTHRHFMRRDRYDDLDRELSVSKGIIEKELGRPCFHFSWPWGDYRTEWWNLLQQAGYKTAVTTRAGANALGTAPYALKRMKVSREDLGWLAQRCRWTSQALAAQSFGFFYGWDRRLKSWLQGESPYSHG